MGKENTNQGFGLAITGLALLAAAFLVTFYLKQCIFGAIIAVISAILGTAAFIEARRARGPKQLALTILIITWLGAIFSIVWTASGTKRMDKSVSEVETETVIETETEIDKEQKLKELEEKMEQLEEEEGKDN
jgi:thiol:disulfide interchange protein